MPAVDMLSKPNASHHIQNQNSVRFASIAAPPSLVTFLSRCLSDLSKPKQGPCCIVEPEFGYNDCDHRALLLAVAAPAAAACCSLLLLPAADLLLLLLLLLLLAATTAAACCCLLLLLLYPC